MGRVDQADDDFDIAEPDAVAGLDVRRKVPPQIFAEAESALLGRRPAAMAAATSARRTSRSSTNSP